MQSTLTFTRFHLLVGSVGHGVADHLFARRHSHEIQQHPQLVFGIAAQILVAQHVQTLDVGNLRCPGVHEVQRVAETTAVIAHQVIEHADVGTGRGIIVDFFLVRLHAKFPLEIIRHRDIPRIAHHQHHGLVVERRLGTRHTGEILDVVVVGKKYFRDLRIQVVKIIEPQHQVFRQAVHRAEHLGQHHPQPGTPALAEGHHCDIAIAQRRMLFRAPQLAFLHQARAFVQSAQPPVQQAPRALFGKGANQLPCALNHNTHEGIQSRKAALTAGGGEQRCPAQVAIRASTSKASGRRWWRAISSRSRAASTTLRSMHSRSSPKKNRSCAGSGCGL